MPTVRLDQLHDAQLQVLREARRFGVLECGRRWGKTRLGIGLCLYAALHGDPAGWFAPRYTYARPVYEDLIRRVPPELVESRDAQTMTLRLRTGGCIEVWSLANNPDAGRSRRYRVAVIDEAAMVDRLMDIWHAAIRPTLTDLHGSAWFLSTPSGYNDFHVLYERAGELDDWARWRMPTTTNPHIDPQEVEAARRELPEHVFAQEYLGIPAPDGGNPFGLDDIAACTLPADAPTGQPVCFGVDLARAVDWTVVVGLDQSGRVARCERWQRTSWQETRRRIAAIIGSSPTYIDATGVGDPIVEALRTEDGRANVRPYVFTARSKQDLMERLANAIQSRSVSFGEGVITQELRTYRYEYRPGGGVRYSAPAGMHDDAVCALALAVAMHAHGGDYHSVAVHIDDGGAARSVRDWLSGLDED